MSGVENEIESAVVIVRPPGYEDNQPITSENLDRALPSDDQVQLVQRLFAEAGFDVSEAFAGSFAIAGTGELFADALPPLPTSVCEGWLAPAEGLLHIITHGGPVELDVESTLDVVPADVAPAGVPPDEAPGPDAEDEPGVDL